MTTSLAPSRASASLIAKPMPRASPVTIAALPSNLMKRPPSSDIHQATRGALPDAAGALSTSSNIGQNDCSGSGEVPTWTMHQADLRVLDLSRAGLAAQLIDSFEQRKHPVPTCVAIRESAAIGIHRKLAAGSRVINDLTVGVFARLCNEGA